jgi:maltoporin
MKPVLTAPVVGLGMMLAGSASAVELHGYLRTAFGGNSQGGSQACFGVPGMDYKFRLGNECDTYGELEFRESVYKDPAGVEFKFYAMLAFFRPGDLSDAGSYENKLRLPNLWFEAKKVPFLGGASAWIGTRYYRRHDVHTLDFFYWNPSGLGCGFEDIDLVFGKLALAVFRTPDDDPLRVTWRPEARVHGIPLNPGGTIELGVDIGYVSDQPNSEGPDRMKVGPWFTVEHVQARLLGGSNRLAFQYAVGPLAGMGGVDNNGGVNPDATSRSTQLRIVEMFQVQPVPQFSGVLVFLFQSKNHVGERPGAAIPLPGDSSTSFGVELRPGYHLNDYFKIQADLGYASYKPKAAGSDARGLFKATIAPTLVAGGGFWSRPEMRLFATWATWNAASQRAGILGSCNPTGASASPFACDTSGLSFGAQVEGWW